MRLLEEAAGKTKASIRAVLARWFPKPDVPDRVQPLSPKGEQGHLGLDGSPVGPRPRVEPLSEERFGVRFTASARLREKLEHARNLMSHVSREFEVVVERALDALIRELENKQWGKTDRPRRSRGTQDGSPSRKDKREVYERDDAQCAFVSQDGVRCASKAFLSKAFLQYDHIEPRALGGSGKADESRLLCQQHNLHHAKQIFGREPVERAIDLRQQKSQPAATGSEPDAAGKSSSPRSWPRASRRPRASRSWPTWRATRPPCPWTSCSAVRSRCSFRDDFSATVDAALEKRTHEDVKMWGEPSFRGTTRAVGEP